MPGAPSKPRPRARGLGRGSPSDPTPLNSLWIEQVAWGSSKSIGDTSSYDISGWGVTGGYDLPIGEFGSVGVTGTWLTGSDQKGGTELFSNHYEGGLYARGGNRPAARCGRARRSAAIDFDSTRNFSSTVNGARSRAPPKPSGTATSIRAPRASPTICKWGGSASARTPRSNITS